MEYTSDTADKTTKFIWLPFFLQISLLLNIVLMYFGIKYIYVICYLIGFVFLLGKFHSSLNVFFYLRIAYLLVTVAVSALQLIVLPGRSMSVALIGLMTYLLAPFFWLLLSLRVDDSADLLKKLFFKLRYVVAGASLLGIYQYFYSPTLWGGVESD